MAFNVRHTTRPLGTAMIGALTLVLGVSAQAPRSMSAVDLLNVPALSDPQLAPDGSALLYVQSDADWARDRRITHVWRVAIDGVDPVQLTRGEHGESSPRWSPDGSRIAFLSRRGDDERTQIHLLPTYGGEASALTDHPTAVSSLVWAPDGSAVYFIASDEKPEHARTRNRHSGQVISLDEGYEQRHLWRVAVPGGTTTRLSSGDFTVMGFSVSDDGTRILFQRSPSPLVESWEQAEIWTMSAGGAGLVRVTDNAISERGARLSPNGREVLFVAGANDELEPFYTPRMFVAPVDGGPPRRLLGELPTDVLIADWSVDGRAIFFVGNVGVRAELFRVDLADRAVTQLTTSGEHSVAGWSYDRRSGSHVLQVTHARSPGDLWLLERGDTIPQRVTHVFDGLETEYKLARQEQVEWTARDGTRIEGILDYPVDYQAGQRYPLVVQTHGGPQSSDRFGWGYWINYTQVLTGMGYAVLKPNYRGGTGYGDEFLRDMVGHYFRNSHLDVMDGVDHVIAMGVADPDRMVKMGWSAGGHMTNKIITHTDRFKAASSGAGGSNFLSFYGQSDLRFAGYRDQWFEGSPWEKGGRVDIAWETSPLKDSWKVATPTIFQVGERDKRVPAAQSVEFFRALRHHGVDTHLYIAPGEPHVYRTLRHQLFKINAELDWFERHARNRDYRWETPPEAGRDEPDDPVSP